MEFQSDKEFHRKALALLVCFFVAFMYVETVLKPYTDPGRTPQSDAAVGAEGGATRADARGTSASQPQTTQGQVAQGQGAQAAVQASEPTAEGVQSEQALRTGIPSDAAIQEAGVLQVETDKLDTRISLLGGRITELHLKEYKENLEKGAKGLDLVHHSEQVPFPLGVYTGEINDAWVNYRVEGNSENQAIRIDSGTQSLVLKGELSDGREITKTLSFSADSYLIDVQVALQGAEHAVALEWNRFLSSEEESLFDPYNTQGFVWFDGQKAQRASASEFSGTQELGAIRWVSLADKYFTATLLSGDEKTQGQALKTGQVFRMRLSGTTAGISAQLFAGPKSYSLLKEIGHQLELNIDFGMLAFISAPLLNLLVFLYGFIGNYGLAIVTLTIGVRLLLYPLNSASFNQMKKMQDLKPEMDRIREQYPDRQEQQVQLMALYKKQGVNPVGGCLPMLLQMPVFFGLYSALMLAVELRHAPFALWITDLSAPEKLMIGGVGIPVMVILFVISMIVQQWTTPSQMDPTQKKIMMVMPIALGFMFASFPSGLTLYWLTSNLISIGQQKGLYWAHDGGKSALKITLAVSASVFALAVIITFL